MNDKTIEQPIEQSIETTNEQNETTQIATTKEQFSLEDKKQDKINKTYLKEYDNKNFARFVNNSYIKYYTPYYQNSLMKDVNISPTRPSEKDLLTWLDNPANNEENLRNVSQFLNYTIMEYRKSLHYYAKILDLDYMVFCDNLEQVSESEAKTKKYKKDRKRAYDLLRSLDVKNSFLNVMMGVVENDAKYFYLRPSEDNLVLQELPQNYCKLTSKHPNGDWAFQFDFSYFNIYGGSLKNYAPEFGIWYSDLIAAHESGAVSNFYQPMPHDKTVCFKFDDNKIESVPPFSAIFPDALEIKEYKDLLKAQAELEAYQFVFFSAPTNKDGKFSMPAQIITQMADAVNAQMPEGVIVSALPNDPVSIDVKSGQNRDKIIGMGQQSYFESLGSPYKVLGGSADNATSIKKSIEADFDFMKHMYGQFERFLNYQISLLGTGFKFRVKFLRKNSFYREDFQATALTAAQNGVSPKYYLASLGLEPFEIQSMLAEEEIDDLVGRMEPIKTAYTATGDESSESTNVDKLSDKGAQTVDLDSNENRSNA